MIRVEKTAYGVRIHDVEMSEYISVETEEIGQLIRDLEKHEPI
jgi:hypothetical protein